MARINQGIYKKIINEGNLLLQKGKQILDNYFDECGFTGDHDSAFEYIGSANSFYINADNLTQEIEVILKSQKFENDSTANKYITLKQELLDCSNEITENARILKTQLECDWSDTEKQTFQSYIILST